MASQASRGRGRQPKEEATTNNWTQPHLQVRNTFLTISPPLCETASGFIEVRRQISDPTSSRSSSLSASQNPSSNSIHHSSHTLSDGPDGPDGPEGSKLSRDRRPSRSADYPLDESGDPTSIGSALHAKGQCKPCAFHPTSTGCAMGCECSFCHLPHKSSGKIRLRPCRGKRMRAKRMIDRLETQIQKDPENFDPTSLDLPPSIEQNSVFKSRLIGRLKEYADQVRAGRSSASETEDGPEDGLDDGEEDVAAAASGEADDAPRIPRKEEASSSTGASSSRAGP